MTQKTVTRTTNDLVNSLRDASPRNSTPDRLFYLCARAADEIDRLQKVIDDYVYIAAASVREIKHLRQSYEKSNEKRCDSDTGGATLTDAEREAIYQAAIRVEALCQRGSQQMAATLRGLLERLK